MLGGDRRRIELAYALQFSLRGTPVLRYGEEIGMGEDLALPERNAIRTPMQWSSSPGGGFSTAPADDIVRPVITGGEYGYETVNVARQRKDPASLLSWFERMIHTIRECPETSLGAWHVVPVDPAQVLVTRFEASNGTMLFLHNLSDRPLTVDVGRQPGQEQDPVEIFSDHPYDDPAADLRGLDLNPYGYRWMRLARRA